MRLLYLLVVLTVDGLEKWTWNDTDVRTFVIDAERLCQMRSYNGYVQSRIVDIRPVATDDEPGGRMAFPGTSWTNRFNMPGSRFPPQPILCYGEKFVVTGLDGQSWLLDDGFVHVFTPFELLAYDVQEGWLYMYENGRLYRMKPNDFEAHARANQEAQDRGMPVPVFLDTRSPNWTDFMVVDGEIFFVADGNVYAWQNDTEVVVGRADAETFNYVLVPVPYRIEVLFNGA